MPDLVVAVASRALFDFEEENKVFEQGPDDRAYMALQLERLNNPAPAGVAFHLVRKLLAFSGPGENRVEVVILSRNDPASGLRVFRSAKAADLRVERGVFTRGRSPYHYLRPLRANLFLSASEEDVRGALAAGFPAARVYLDSAAAGRPRDRERALIIVRVPAPTCAWRTSGSPALDDRRSIGPAVAHEVGRAGS